MPNKIYYRVEFETISALSIGTTDSNVTDHDMVLDSRGLPLIPGTSLAGAYRQLFYNPDAEESDLECRRVFGDLQTGNSPLRVYDATFVGGNGTIAIRDSVSLKDKVAIPGLKFDRQIVESGARFVTYLEILRTPQANDRVGCTPEDVERILAALDNGTIALGAKTTRGLGRVRVIDCRMRRFSLPDDKDAWLEFDMFGDLDKHWNKEASNVRVLISTDSNGNKTSRLAQPANDRLVMRLALTLRGGISVREYSTEVEQADFSQLIVHANANSDIPLPVIPGTSWTGAIRSRYEQLADQLQAPKDSARNLFGYVGKNASGETAARRSRISFSESVIEGGEWITYTRNAIDRITGGTIPGALFTERSYFGGASELVITVERPGDFDSKSLEPLIAALADLHNGFLAVGGLTSVGRGLFRIDESHSSLWLPNTSSEEAKTTGTEFFSSLLAEDSNGFAQPDLRMLAAMLTGGEV